MIRYSRRLCTTGGCSRTSVAGCRHQTSTTAGRHQPSTTACQLQPSTATGVRALASSLVFALTTVSLLVFGLPQNSCAAAPPTQIRADSFALDAALQRVAIKFFRPETIGMPYRVEREDRIEMHSHGLEFETYVVQRDYAPVGRFIRMRVFLGSDTRLDLAFLLDGQKVKTVMPLRIPVIEGRPVLSLDSLFSPFSAIDCTVYGPPMAALFEGLVYLPTIAAKGKQAGPVLSEAAGRKLSKALFESLPPPVQTCPEFSVTTRDDKKLTRGSFSSKALIVCFNSVTDSHSRHLQEVVQAFWRRNMAHCSLLTFTLDHPDEIAAFRHRGGTLASHVVDDWDEEYKEKFKVPTVPYLLGFNQDGRRLLSTLHRCGSETEHALASFVKAATGKTAVLGSFDRSSSAGNSSDRGSSTVGSSMVRSSGSSSPAAPFEQATLRQVARSLFPAITTEEKLSIEVLSTTELYAKGLEYSNVALHSAVSQTRSKTDGATQSSTDGATQSSRDGSFTVLKVYLAGGQTMTVAFRLEKDCIVAAVPVEPIKLATKTIVTRAALEELFKAFTNVRCDRYGAAMSTLYAGLVPLGQIAANQRPKALVEEQKGEPQYGMKLAQARPRLGAPCPNFRGRSLTGERISRFSFEEKPFILFFGSVTDSMSLEVLDELTTFCTDELKKKVALLGVYKDKAPALLERLRLGYRFPGRTVTDDANEISSVLAIPYTPYILAYDRSHHLRLAIPYRGRFATRQALKTFISSHATQ